MTIETKYSVGDKVVLIPTMSRKKSFTGIGTVKRIKFETSGDVSICRYMCTLEDDNFLHEYREDQMLTVEEYESILVVLETTGK